MTRTETLPAATALAMSLWFFFTLASPAFASMKSIESIVPVLVKP
jgi:hypothetical protein